MSRKVQLGSNYQQIKKASDISRIETEIVRMHPKTEVTIEGASDIAKGRIVEWFPKRKFFSVQWTKIPAGFAHQSGTKSGLRVFFKAQMFSTQIVFKSTTLRRLGAEETENGVMIYHYRIPEEIFQQEQRGALRVPIEEGTASIKTKQGDYDIIDLNVSGAKLRIPPSSIIPPSGTEWKGADLYIGDQKVNNIGFRVKIIRITNDECTIQFSKISDFEKIRIKQFLIEALRTYCAKQLKPRT